MSEPFGAALAAPSGWEEGATAQFLNVVGELVAEEYQNLNELWASASEVSLVASAHAAPLLASC